MILKQKNVFSHVSLTHFLVLIYFLVLIFIYIYIYTHTHTHICLAVLHNLGILVPQPGMDPVNPCIGSVESYPLGFQGSPYIILKVSFSLIN